MSDLISDYLPPQALDAEMAILGAALISRTAADSLLALLSGADFYLAAHRQIFEAIAYLVGRAVVPEPLTVEQELRERGQLAGIGGAAYLFALQDAVPTAAHAEYYARIVADKSTRRKLIDVAAGMTAEAYNGERSVAEVVGAAEAALFAAHTGKGRQSFRGAGELAADARPVLSGEQAPEKGVPTGYDALDHLLAGWRKSRLYLLAARPGVGKTAAAVNFALRAAKRGVGIGIFSLEMEQGDLWNRCLSVTAQVDGSKFDRGDLDHEERIQASLANADLAGLPLWILDDRELTLAQVRSHARRLVRQHRVGLLILDYLQLVIPPPGREADVRHYTAVAEGLKSMSRELGVPVLALSQLSRNVERREVKKPTLADLRESGGLEQAGDTIILLYRDNYYRRLDGERLEGPDETLFTIAKNRQGKTGVVSLSYRPQFLEFAGLEERYA
jgi:replicative DNA helicase